MNFLDYFKKDRPVEMIIHNLALNRINNIIKLYGYKRPLIEVFENNGFFEEIKSKKYKARDKDLDKKIKNNSFVILHTLKLNTTEKILKKNQNKSFVVILTHNYYSLDHLLSLISYKLGLSSYNKNLYIKPSQLKKFLRKENFYVVEEFGSFFSSKMIIIFFPTFLQNKLKSFFFLLDKIFSKSLLKVFARNYFIAVTTYHEGLKSSINEKYTKLSLNFDNDYNQNTYVGKSYLRNVDRLMEEMNIKEGEKVLDIGTGTGTYSLFAAFKKAQVTALDISEDMLNLAKTKAKSSKLPIKFICGDAEELPFPDKYFDKIMTASVPHDVNNVEIFIEEMSRVLKPGGRIYMNIFNFLSIGGIAVLIKVTLRVYPKVNIFFLPDIRKMSRRSNLKLVDLYGIELLQGFPLPWFIKWGFVNKFDFIDKYLSKSYVKYIYSQFVIILEKKE